MRKLALTAIVGTLVAVSASACGGSANTTATSPQNGHCAVQAPSGLVKDGTLVFGTSLTLPPQDFQQNGKPTGSDIEIASALAEQMCLKPQFTNLDFQGILPGVDARKFDAAVATFGITPEREKAFDFVPYFIGGQAMLTTKKSGLKISGIEDVCGHEFAVLSGSVELANLQTAAPKCPGGESAKYSVYQSQAEIVEQLIKGTQNLAYLDWTQSAYAVKQRPDDLALASDIFSGRGKDTQPNKEGIVVRKGDTAMKTALTEALTRIRQDGTYGKILTKYGLERGDISKAGN